MKRNKFTNNYGYGPFGAGPQNGGFDSFGYYKDKFYNSGVPPVYTWASYRNYYPEFTVHKNKYGRPAPADFEALAEERWGKLLQKTGLNFFVGPYYNGVWGYRDHSRYWYG